jgi:predicted nucleic acid-binding protein
VIVVDASALLEALLRTPLGASVENRLLDPSESLHVPHLLDIEIAQVLRRFVMARDIGPERAQAALEDLQALPLWRHSHGFLLPRVWTMRDNITAYDAVYVALAEVLEATLLTHDRRLAISARKFIPVELV